MPNGAHGLCTERPDRYFWIITGLWSLLNGLVFLQPQLASWLEYRAPLLFSQPWRLVTGHLIHLSPLHWLLNAAGLLILWQGILAEVPARLKTAWLLASMPLISLLLWVDAPHVQWYVGLSGALHALWAAGGLYLLCRPGQRAVGGALLGLLATKLLWPDSPGEHVLHHPVVGEAHLFGALTGLFLALSACPFKQHLKQNPSA